MSQSILDAVPDDLAPVARAAAVQAMAARAGFDWPDTAAMMAKIAEEAAELRAACASGDKEALREELGDLLLILVNVARAEGLDAAACLQSACGKFERRFRLLEADLAARGRRIRDETPGALDALWERVKTQEGGG
ncbi:MAG: MazG nucleotide pyrophosphohydrolase domain-containing protein [Myxococcota bacterium]